MWNQILARLSIKPACMKDFKDDELNRIESKKKLKFSFKKEKPKNPILKPKILQQPQSHNVGHSHTRVCLSKAVNLLPHVACARKKQFK